MARKPLTPEQLERKTRLQRERRAERRKHVVRAPRARRQPPKPIPVHIRDAWRRSHRNSILQQKYPTYAALQRAAQEGAFD